MNSIKMYTFYNCWRTNKVLYCKFSIRLISTWSIKADLCKVVKSFHPSFQYPSSFYDHSIILVIFHTLLNYSFFSIVSLSSRNGQYCKLTGVNVGLHCEEVIMFFTLVPIPESCELFPTFPLMLSSFNHGAPVSKSILRRTRESIYQSRAKS